MILGKNKNVDSLDNGRICTNNILTSVHFTINSNQNIVLLRKKCKTLLMPTLKSTEMPSLLWRVLWLLVLCLELPGNSFENDVLAEKEVT